MGLTTTNQHMLSNIPTKAPPLHHHHHPLRSFTLPSAPSSHQFRAATIVAASKRTGKFDSKNRKNSSVSTKDEVEEELVRISGIETAKFDASGSSGELSFDGKPMPQLPGLEPDFWEGPKWDALGFFIQYMWAFGILFGLVSGGLAVATYNEGAADFKDTPVYKEAIQSRELLEEPEGSNAEVFESNPTEQAPNVE